MPNPRTLGEDQKLSFPILPPTYIFFPGGVEGGRAASATFGLPSTHSATEIEQLCIVELPVITPPLLCFEYLKCLLPVMEAASGAPKSGVESAIVKPDKRQVTDVRE